ncbi:hypothetical protein ACFL55_03255 [Candidatus Latescibacterota bacterium]
MKMHIDKRDYVRGIVHSLLVLFPLVYIFKRRQAAARPNTGSSPYRLALQMREYGNDILEKWKALLDIWDREADRFWARSNIFLIVNGALLVAVTSFSESHFVGFAISLFGVLFVRIWIKVNTIGKYYLDRWKVLMIRLEDKWDDKIIGELSQIALDDPRATRFKSSTTYMLYALYLIMALWILILLYEGYQLIAQNMETILRVIYCIP